MRVCWRERSGSVMPTSPPRACATCGRVACAIHRRAGWPTVPPVARKTGHWLQRERAWLFARHPLCVVCEQQGRVTVATVRDHIVPLAEGGADTRANTQALCEACNQEKASRESVRGRSRR